MVLTGKTKEDFFKWVNIKENDFGYVDCEPRSVIVHFENLYDNLQNALIIEWFDSVNIYIDCAPLFFYNQKIFTCLVNDEMVSSVQYKTRSEATQQAIIKANEIYNNLNK